MWLVEFLPNWLMHAFLLGGILAVVGSFILKMVPVVATYRLPILVGGLTLAAAGLFLEGASINEDKWKMRVAEAEKRAVEAEAKSTKENVKLVTQTVEKLKLVTEQQVVIEKEIVEKATAIDADCRVPLDAVKVHNKAATRPEGLK